LTGTPIRARKALAQVAQLVEQRIENPRVAGSIPALGTIYPLDTKSLFRELHL
jgi:hypothetical protein